MIIAAGLIVGAVPLLVGLAVVLPVLGHASWHLYRRLIELAPTARPEFHRRPKGQRYAAQFPASLFTRSSDPHE